MKTLAKVELSRAAPRKGRPRLWGYSYPDLARLFGMREPAVRQAARRGAFDPSDMESVVAFALRRRPELAG
jgi:hypothetical protein